ALRGHRQGRVRPPPGRHAPLQPLAAHPLRARGDRAGHRRFGLRQRRLPGALSPPPATAPHGFDSLAPPGRLGTARTGHLVCRGMPARPAYGLTGGAGPVYTICIIPSETAYIVRFVLFANQEKEASCRELFCCFCW